jgi:hypothetical protein
MLFRSHKYEKAMEDIKQYRKLMPDDPRGMSLAFKVNRMLKKK